MFDRSTGEIRTFGSAEDVGGGGEGEIPAGWTLASNVETGQAWDAAPAVYQLGGAEEAEAMTGEHGGDGEPPPDSLLSSATDDGWDNEERRLQEKRFTPERLVRNARADIGSDKWAPTDENGEVKNHCNEYVASKLRESGAHVPTVGGPPSGFIGPRPPRKACRAAPAWRTTRPCPSPARIRRRTWPRPPKSLPRPRGPASPWTTPRPARWRST